MMRPRITEMAMHRTEEWRPVYGWPYEVSSVGRVRNAKTHRILRTFKTTKGYNIVQLARPGEVWTVRVHRLVASAFLPDFRLGLQVDHRNRDRGDDSVVNLRMATASQNAKHRSVNQNNYLGIKGVSVHRGRFVARIQVDGRRLVIGYYDELWEAAAAYRLVELRDYGAFARRHV